MVLLIILGVVFIGSGAAKLASVPFTVQNFARWPIPETTRKPIGAIEVVIGALALIGIGVTIFGTIAAIGVIVSMVVATAVHLRAQDPLPLTVAAPVFLLLGIVSLLVN